MIGRSFMYGLSVVAPGYRLQDSSRAKDQILSQLSKQYHRQCKSPCCLRCGQKLQGPTLYTADAGQAFEWIDPSRINRASRIICKSIEIVTDRKAPTLTCMHTTKSNDQLIHKLVKLEQQAPLIARVNSESQLANKRTALW